MKSLTLLQDYYHDIIYFTDKNNIDEAIAELEALQQPKSCEGCVHLDRGRFCTLSASNHCIRDAEDYFKLKEQ